MKMNRRGGKAEGRPETTHNSRGKEGNLVARFPKVGGFST